MDNATFARIGRSLLTFRQWLRIEVDGVLRPLAECEDDWQRKDFEAIAPALHRVAGLPADGGLQRAYLERPRGHSKTQDTAVALLWALVASRKPLSMVWAAADQDQGGLCRDAITRLVATNPELADFVNVQRWVVLNPHTGSKLEIMASDVGSSYGILVDILVIDEIAHWEPAGEELWHSLFSAAAKKAACMMVVISNAGCGQGSSWQWNLREACRRSASWYFSRLDGPVASWINAAALEEQRRLLPASVYARLWSNEWSSAAGDAFSEEQITATIVSDEPLYDAPDSFTIAAIGVDAGLSNHHSGICVLLGDRRRQRVRVARVWDLAPPVRLETIKMTVLRAALTYGVKAVFCDAWEMMRVSEELAAAGLQVVAERATGNVLVKQAAALLQVFQDRMLETYSGGDGDLLLEDLRGCRVVQRPYGHRLELCENQHGHSDRLAALVQALPAVLEGMGCPEPVPFAPLLPQRTQPEPFWDPLTFN